MLNPQTWREALGETTSPTEAQRCPVLHVRAGPAPSPLGARPGDLHSLALGLESRVTAGDSPPSSGSSYPPGPEMLLSDPLRTPLCQHGHQDRQGQKALAISLVHLIDGETEAPGVRRPARGPSVESAPGHTQNQVPRLPNASPLAPSTGADRPGLELGLRATQGAFACCPRVAAAGAAPGSCPCRSVWVPRGGDAPWCQARGGCGDHGPKDGS